MRRTLKEFIFGFKIVLGGECFLDPDKPNRVYYAVSDPVWKRIRTQWPLMAVEFEERGVTYRYKNRFVCFFWKPYSPLYISKEGEVKKSRRFQFLTFKINELERKKGCNMWTKVKNWFSDKWNWLTSTKQSESKNVIALKKRVKKRSKTTPVQDLETKTLKVSETKTTTKSVDTPVII